MRKSKTHSRTSKRTKGARSRRHARKQYKKSNWFCRVFYKTKRRIMTSRFGRGLCKAWSWIKPVATVVNTLKGLYVLGLFITWVISVI